jgi:hypothetical protein
VLARIQDLKKKKKNSISREGYSAEKKLLSTWIDGCQ